MNFADYLRRLRSSPDYQDQIEHVELIPARSAKYADTGRPLNAELSARLREQGIERLYTHQARAVDSVRDGRHVVVVTPTASGKTLAYNIPVLEEILGDPRAKALYLFPTKALAQDQLGKLNDFGFFPRVRFATYDGDTPQTDRRFIKRGAHIVLTNPDMLHVGILPYHTSWAQFYMNLRFVVIDEIHSYRGVFGAHVAQIIRRLRRICRHYGSNPRFIACSATVANPDELVRAVTGVEAEVVDDEGAPAGRRSFVFWNPPLVGQAGERASANMEATSLFKGLVEDDVRTLVFTKARKSAELILKYTREALTREGSGLGRRIMSYRAGYTPQERRDIEQGLFRGDLIGITSTNALELGVDVGDLDATVLTGYPGTIASAWQQAGRAGRGGGESLSVMVALDGPLDQYLMRHPEYFFGQIHERAIVDPGNRRILEGHLQCAAYETPLSEEDLLQFDPAARDALTGLEEAGRLIWRGGRWYYRGDGYPASEINIRSISSEMYEIREGAGIVFERDEAGGSLRNRGRLIGVIDGARAYQTVHPGAIYLHQGETYVVEQLDEADRVASVRPVDAGYYTEPREITQITVLSERESRALPGTTAYFGEVVVTTQVLGYRVKQLYSDTVLDIVDLDLPEQVFETEAYWYTVPAALAQELARAGLDLCGSIHAAEHAAIGMMPLYSTCDRWDLGGVSTPHHPDTGMATVFVYDGYPGGVGICEGTYDRLEGLLTTTAEMISTCPCQDGCPSCVQSPKCGNNNEPLDKRGALLLLQRLLQSPESTLEPTKQEAAA